MVKARKRSTCTECSLRRQQCDRRLPCGRCIKRGIPDKCQLNWQEGRYDPSKHRAYPSRHRDFRPTPPAGNAEQPADLGLLQGLPGQEVSLEPEESWGSFSSSAAHPRYVFTPYESKQLRKSATGVHSGIGTSIFSSAGPMSSLPSTRALHEAYLQMLMPSLDHIWKLVNYHEAYLLWYHCCYHGPTFRSELESVIAEQKDKTTLLVSDLDGQWLALLFSIMAGSLTCTAEWRLRDWGFSQQEAVKLSMQWYRASITCLNYGEWTSEHKLYSVQAVTTLAMSAHSLGQSSELSILLGAALKIAQTLGLDKISHDAVVDKIDERSSNDQRHRSLNREIGRKLWSQLCVQDWMSLPFAGSHHINPSHFTTTKPSSRNHLTMEYLPATFPTYISYGNYIFEIAKLVVGHHEATLQSTTPFTKYQHVLDYDAQMRNLATKGMPRYFHVVEPVDALWPEWVHWARSSLTVCFAHKIIMIHRAFIRQSFTNPVYSMTRVTCIAAAKTILNEAKKAKDSNGPIIWIDKGFCVAAAVILCLDIFHRKESDPELSIHKGLVVECIEQLHKFESSAIAVRGASLLAGILAHGNSARNGSDWPPLSIDTREILKLIPEVSPLHGGGALEALVELLPPQAGFSNIFLSENIFGHNTVIS
ncbi:uncharacterized protein A1O9_06683 [Exophiala aquamarina CBS 119918]|uniref:Zn(2)-C6 fungal-type domain-containing protein n=1 Tax=Exophiala aquamarina CBS 119918 TaxID=1182545 RepID=A0A072PG93_9EURO|nr:uncharacterized protein A1O9_06683 [Exophiala aquamarina CBS 119918]KEF58757.1 hypothetical protein A1O9_06683 [Exophiala aquamarina CBS 119918]